MTGDQELYLGANNRLKELFDFVSLFGGPHPTFFPDMIEREGVDIICRGEGEEALVELLDKLQSKESILDIQNLSVKQNQTIIRNPLRPFSDLDSLPFPDRTLLEDFPEAGNGPIKHFLATRGCPFSCSYCFNEQYSELYRGKGKRVRFRDPSSLIQEVQETISIPGSRFVYFQDDTFTLNERWLAEFSRQYQHSIDLPFHCHVRANTVSEEKVRLLKEAGCYSVHIAAETADDRLRNEILNRNMSKEQVFDACDLLRKYGIKFMLQNMIGLPTGSLENDLETLEMNIACQPDYAWVSIYQPYPGTPLGEYCRSNGIYSGDFSDLDSNFFDSTKLNFSDQYKTQLQNLQKLFAIFVEYPELHRLGLSRTMIDLPQTEELRQSYQRAYKEFRKKADERLYGFEL